MNPRVLLLIAALPVSLFLLGVVWWTWPHPTSTRSMDVRTMGIDGASEREGFFGSWGRGSRGHATVPPTPMDSEARWSMDVDARIIDLLADYEGLYRIECVPESPDFEAPHPVDFLGKQPTAVPWLALPDGAFRMEVPTPTGDHVVRTELGTMRLRWDVQASPVCTVGPTPRRRVSLTIDVEGEGLLLYTCMSRGDATPVTTGQHLEIELEAQETSLDSKGHRCDLGVTRGGTRLAEATIDVDAPGPAVVEWEDPPPPRTEPFDRVAYLEDLLARTRVGEHPWVEPLTRQVDALEYLIREDPSLRPHLEARLTERRAQRDEAQEHQVDVLQGQLEEARAEAE